MSNKKLPITKYILIPVEFYDEGDGSISAYAPIDDGQSILSAGGYTVDEALQELQNSAISKFKHWIVSGNK